MPTVVTRCAGETRALGRRLAQSLRGGELIAFTGGLGAGKTTFCAGIAEGLGCTDPVQSPTYTIANLYRGPIPFAHFDAYRVTSESDFETAGFYDYLDAGAVVAVEWSERVIAWLEPGAIRVDMAVIHENTREIRVEGALGW